MSKDSNYEQFQNFHNQRSLFMEWQWPTLDELRYITNPPLRKAEYARIPQTRINTPVKRLHPVATNKRPAKSRNRSTVLPVQSMQVGSRATLPVMLEMRYRVATSQHPQPICNCNAMPVAHKHEDNGIFPYEKT